HHYRERRVISPTVVIDHIKPHRLGPFGTLHLYEVPPVSAQSLATPGFTAWWVMYSNPGDEVSGYFESNSGGTEASPIAGKFELRLQLFKNVSSDATTATLVAEPPADDPFSIPQTAGPDDTVDAVTPPASMLETNGSGQRQRRRRPSRGRRSDRIRPHRDDLLADAGCRFAAGRLRQRRGVRGGA